MSKISIIDEGLRDFLRSHEDGLPIVIDGGFDEAEEWLLENGDDHGWTNSGVRYIEWE